MSKDQKVQAVRVANVPEDEFEAAGSSSRTVVACKTYCRETCVFNTRVLPRPPFSSDSGNSFATAIARRPSLDGLCRKDAQRRGITLDMRARPSTPAAGTATAPAGSTRPVADSALGSEPPPAAQVPAFVFTDCAGIRVQ